MISYLATLIWPWLCNCGLGCLSHLYLVYVWDLVVFMIQVNRTVFIAGPKRISIKFVTVVELHFLGAFVRMGETIQFLAGVTT